jgi:hypothetical protein
MAQISSKLRSLQGGRLAFYCPGCREIHQVTTGAGPGPRWKFDGNAESPTFEPSIHVTWKEPSNVPEDFDDESKDVAHCCHSFVRSGQIQFLPDCTHHLSGQTVALPDLPN